MHQSLLTGLLYGAGALPRIVKESSAAFQPLGNKKMLLNLMLDGGPDLRHMIVPPYSTNPSDFGHHYWTHRIRSHSIDSNNPINPQTYWSANFDHRSANGVAFGISKNCSWFTDMWDQGNVAIICNAFGIDSRAHDHATIVLEQGNRSSLTGDINRSGWGGRLATAMGANAVGLTNIPSHFCFGPQGSDINAVDNSNLVSVSDSRSIGFYEFDRSGNARYPGYKEQAARSAKSYYKTLQTRLANDSIYQRVISHEQSIRYFGQLVQTRLASVPIPPRIRALYDANVPEIGNLTPLLSTPYFGRQIRNAFDTMASHDLLEAGVMSMEYGGWDSHSYQASGINNKLEDIFGADKGFSALWRALVEDINGVNSNRENLVILAAGEFGRQIRDNGDNGTDHGEGNMMFLFGEKVTGGVYGDLFPLGEIDRIQDTSLSTPDTIGLTQIDHHFSEICNWIEPGSATSVFPDKGSAIIEQVGMFDTLLQA